MFGRQATGADDLHRRRRHDHHPGRRLYEQESLGLRDRHAERRPWRADHPRRLRLGCRPAVRRTALVLVRVRRHRVSRLAHLRAACGPAAPRAESCWRSESCCGIESVHTTLDSLDGLSDRTACPVQERGWRLLPHGQPHDVAPEPGAQRLSQRRSQRGRPRLLHLWMVSHGVQPQPPWVIPAAAVSRHMVAGGTRRSRLRSSWPLARTH